MVVTAVQGSILDPQVEGSEEGTRPLATVLERVDLGAGAWLDVGRNWVAGSEAIFERLLETVPWQSERRHMYDRIVDVPRLLRFYESEEPLPDPLLDRCREDLNEWYGVEAGGPFVTLGMARYRDGRDSVAWHGDTIGRASSEDTLVAVLSLGAPRRFLLRPRTGGASIRYELGGGDLLVMGGSCQRTWEHSIPKTARAVGERISVQFRQAGVR